MRSVPARGPGNASCQSVRRSVHRALRRPNCFLHTGTNHYRPEGRIPIVSGTNKSNNTLLGVLDNGHLTARYYMVFVVVTLIAIVEFFDFFQIAYVVSMVAGPWHLTYGESAVVLMAA